MKSASGGKSKKKKKVKRSIKRGQAHIQATYNNTIISISDAVGNVIVASSSGKCGFKGPKKATPYAANMIVRDLAEKMREAGMQQVDVIVKGVGQGREGAIRAFHSNGFEVMSILDVTPIPHNGCRLPKPRRV